MKIFYLLVLGFLFKLHLSTASPIAPPTWTCSPSFYGQDDYCDCGCGLYDPDCDKPGAYSYGCDAPFVCNNQSINGECQAVDLLSCPASSYGTGDGCDCGCSDGFNFPRDPDCIALSPANDCSIDEVCNFDSQCQNITEAFTVSGQWTCPLEKLTNGVCDCNCGLLDPECFANNISPSCPSGSVCVPGFGGFSSFCAVQITGLDIPVNRTSVSICEFDLEADPDFFDKLLTSFPNLEELTVRGKNSSVLTLFPVQLFSLPSLKKLSLSNLLSGPIPANIGDMSQLLSLNLAQNKLTGEIPDSLYTILGLSRLTLAENSITGTIKPLVQQLQNLTLLDVSSNELDGRIPFELTSIGFQTNTLPEFGAGGGFEDGGGIEEILLDCSIADKIFGKIESERGVYLGNNNFKLLCDCEFLDWYVSWTNENVRDPNKVNDCSDENQFGGLSPLFIGTDNRAPCYSSEYALPTLGNRNATIRWLYSGNDIFFDNNDNLGAIAFASKGEFDQAVKDNLDLPDPNEDDPEAEPDIDIDGLYKSGGGTVEDAFRSCQELILPVIRVNNTYQLLLLEEFEEEFEETFDSRILENNTEISPSAPSWFGFEVDVKKSSEPSFLASKFCVAVNQFSLNDRINGAFNLFVDELSPFTTYEYRVQPFKIYSEYIGDPVLQKYIGGIKSSWISFKTEEDIPESFPTGLRASKIRPREVQLEWEAPGELGINGEIIGYKVDCENCPLPSYIVNSRFALISSLTPKRTYRFNVRVINGAGVGPPALLTPIEIETCDTNTEDNGNGCEAEAGKFRLSDGTIASCESFDAIVQSSCVEATTELLELKAGYWRPNVFKTEFLFCPISEYCNKENLELSKKNSSTTGRLLQAIPPESLQCKEHHLGTFCSECEDGYAMSLDKGCVLCSDSTVEFQQQQLVLFAMTVLILGLSLVFLQLFQTRRKSTPSDKGSCFSFKSEGSTLKWLIESVQTKIGVKLEIGLAFLQVLSAFQQILYLDQVAQETNILEIVSGINLGLLAYSFGVECVINLNHYLELVFYTVPPILEALLLLGVYLFFTRVIAPSWKDVMKVETTLVLFTLSLLVFPGACKTIIDTFICREFETATNTNGIFKSALSVDYTVSCELTDERIGWIAYALLMVLIYPVGITASYAYMLHIYDKDKSNEKNKALVNSLIYKYKSKYFWFEVFELLRKLTMTSFVSAFVLLGAEMAEIMALNVSIAFFAAIMYIKPYRNNYDNTFAMISLGLLVVSTQLKDFFESSNDLTQFFNALIYVEAAAFAGLIAMEIYKQDMAEENDNTNVKVVDENDI